MRHPPASPPEATEFDEQTIADGKFAATLAAAPGNPPTRHSYATGFTGGSDFAPEINLAPGMTVDHYEVIRELGRGGMGCVYLARDLTLGRRVALKILAAPSRKRAELFLTEARATARFQHENIVVIYQVGDWSGMPYMALELLEGQTLGSWAQGRTLSPQAAVDKIRPVVKALQAAHEHGLVHRDLKPDNIFVTADGTVKVLDFGLAQLLSEESETPAEAGEIGQVVEGTVPYMAPEQWRRYGIGPQTDFWALGIIFWELLAGKHPLEPLSMHKLMLAAHRLDEAMPPLSEGRSDVGFELERVVARCLQKRVENRYPSAEELLDGLDLAYPQVAVAVQSDRSPFPGLQAFGEADAGTFFGRGHDIAQLQQKLEDQPLVAVVGPSGVGKSSLVRAGVMPALKLSDETWTTETIRPGRRPIEALASLLLRCEHSAPEAFEHGELVEPAKRLRREPGAAGVALRQAARTRRCRILVFVDQFEEVFTLVSDGEERRLFFACLAAIADDASSPLRVILSLRSDFLDRVAEEPVLHSLLTPGLSLLPPPGPQSLRDALLLPLQARRYGFEDLATAEEMLDFLGSTPSALPLLQFAASQLWEHRDSERRLITRTAYQKIGGIEGALSQHADQVLERLPSPERKLAAAVLLRLITPERTRAIVEEQEIVGLSDNPATARDLLRVLVDSRLVVVRGAQDGGVLCYELAHEALILEWPTLRRWLDEAQEDAAFVDQLRTASRQWEQAGRSPDLLWRGELASEAQTFRSRARAELTQRERDFLLAVIEQDLLRSRRSRRLRLGAVLALGLLLLASLVAVALIRDAERQAQRERSAAEKEAGRAQDAEREAEQRQVSLEGALQKLQQEQRATREAKDAASAADRGRQQAETEVERSEQDLASANVELKAALGQARAAKSRAEEMATKAEKTAAELAKKNRQLSDQLRKAKLTTTLK